VKIGVLGSGNIGGTLGRKWAAAGHEVTFGVRDPSAARAPDLNAASVAKIPDAIRDADVVVFAIPGAAMADTVQAVGRELEGKTVIDATNNLGGTVAHSLDAIGAAAPRARAYRAFNTLGWENFADPVIGGVQSDLFYAGPEGESQTAVEQLISDAGLRPIRLGGTEQAALVDAVLRIWFTLAVGQGRGRRLGFKVLTP
jgi:predicted dinucleotide-binding enzyme